MYPWLTLFISLSIWACGSLHIHNPYINKEPYMLVNTRFGLVSD
jgi:hypothetical protein